MPRIDVSAGGPAGLDTKVIIESEVTYKRSFAVPYALMKYCAFIGKKFFFLKRDVEEQRSLRG